MAYKVHKDFEIEFRKSTDEDNKPAISVRLYHIEAEGDDDYASKITNSYNSLKNRDNMFEKLNCPESANYYWSSIFSKLLQINPSVAE